MELSEPFAIVCDVVTPIKKLQGPRESVAGACVGRKFARVEDLGTNMAKTTTEAITSATTAK